MSDDFLESGESLGSLYVEVGYELSGLDAQERLLQSRVKAVEEKLTITIPVRVDDSALRDFESRHGNVLRSPGGNGTSTIAASNSVANAPLQPASLTSSPPQLARAAASSRANSGANEILVAAARGAELRGDATAASELRAQMAPASPPRILAPAQYARGGGMSGIDELDAEETDKLRGRYLTRRQSILDYGYNAERESTKRSRLTEADRELYFSGKRYAPRDEQLESQVSSLFDSILGNAKSGGEAQELAKKTAGGYRDLFYKTTTGLREQDKKEVGDYRDLFYKTTSGLRDEEDAKGERFQRNKDSADFAKYKADRKQVGDYRDLFYRTTSGLRAEDEAAAARVQKMGGSASDTDYRLFAGKQLDDLAELLPQEGQGLSEKVQSQQRAQRMGKEASERAAGGRGGRGGGFMGRNLLSPYGFGNTFLGGGMVGITAAFAMEAMARLAGQFGEASTIENTEAPRLLEQASRGQSYDLSANPAAKEAAQKIAELQARQMRVTAFEEFPLLGGFVSGAQGVTGGDIARKRALEDQKYHFEEAQRRELTGIQSRTKTLSLSGDEIGALQEKQGQEREASLEHGRLTGVPPELVEAQHKELEVARRSIDARERYLQATHANTDLQVKEIQLQSTGKPLDALKAGSELRIAEINAKFDQEIANTPDTRGDLRKKYQADRASLVAEANEDNEHDLGQFLKAAHRNDPKAQAYLDNTQEGNRSELQSNLRELETKFNQQMKDNPDKRGDLEKQRDDAIRVEKEKFKADMARLEQETQDSVLMEQAKGEAAQLRASHNAFGAQMTEFNANAKAKVDAARPVNKDEADAMEKAFDVQRQALNKEQRERVGNEFGNTALYAGNSNDAVRAANFLMARDPHAAEMTKFDGQQRELDERARQASLLDPVHRGLEYGKVDADQRKLDAEKKASEFLYQRDLTTSNIGLDAEIASAKARVDNHPLQGRVIEEGAGALERLRNAPAALFSKTRDAELAQLQASRHDMLGWHAGGVGAAGTSLFTPGDRFSSVWDDRKLAAKKYDDAEKALKSEPAPGGGEKSWTPQNVKDAVDYLRQILGKLPQFAIAAPPA